MSASKGSQILVESNSGANILGGGPQKQSPPEDDDPPFVPTKDTADSGSITGNPDEAYFRPGSLSRTASTFSFSRASFSSQISSLTALSLPQAESLAAGISAIPSSARAIKALSTSAEQIQLWTRKAQKVLENLDGDDDIEWAGAAGREGLDDTDRCVTNFENLVLVYVQAIEELQSRPDIGDVEPDDLQEVVEQMESTLDGWEKVRKGMKEIRDQVEIAMEWEELWGVVLGDVGNEMDELSQLVFEMEEKRHMSMYSESQNETAGLDINELENIVEDNPTKARQPASYRFSMPPAFTASPATSPIAEAGHDDSNLLALFARMQPLRASLDFLPMRLSMFQSRAKSVFPTACEELEDKRLRLEDGWKQLAKEAEDLRSELGEDRWVLVFRNAGRQAQKMCESVERSIEKLQEAIEAGLPYDNPAAFSNRVEGFEAKRTHYGPAIDRVLAIIRKGVNDRLTVNGEIIRLHTDMSARARDLQASVNAMERTLNEINLESTPQLRDSISTVLSTDRSLSGTTTAETPGSSPASSVIVLTTKTDRRTSTNVNGARNGSHPPLSSQNMRSASYQQPRRPTTPRTIAGRIASPAPPSIYRQGLYTPPTAQINRPGPIPICNRPRWSSSATSKSNSTSATARKTTPTHVSTTPLRSPLSRETSASPTGSSYSTSTAGRRPSTHLPSFAERVGSPLGNRPPNRNGYSRSRLMDPVPYHRGRNITAPTHGTMRSPSSVAVQSNHKPTMSVDAHQFRRPPSAPSQSFSASTVKPMSMRPKETELPLSPAVKTEDSGIDMRNDDDFDGDTETALNSSPLPRPRMAPKVETAPGPAVSRAGKGKRASMLPVPKARSGRDSAMSGAGDVLAWK